MGSSSTIKGREQLSFGVVLKGTAPYIAIGSLWLLIGIATAFASYPPPFNGNFSADTDVGFIGNQLEGTGYTSGAFTDYFACDPYPYDYGYLGEAGPFPLHECFVASSSAVSADLKVSRNGSEACSDEAEGSVNAEAECSGQPTSHGIWTATTVHVVEGFSVLYVCVIGTNPLYCEQTEPADDWEFPLDETDAFVNVPAI